MTTRCDDHSLHGSRRTAEITYTAAETPTADRALRYANTPVAIGARSGAVRT